jgi:hypothetical protein
MSWRPSYRNVVRHLSTPSLYAEVLKLDNSIKHLKRSNKELQLHGESEDDGQWALDVVKENEDVIAKQEEQIEIVKAEIIGRAQTEHEEMVVESGNDKVEGNLNGNGVRTSQVQGSGELMDLEDDDGLHL